MKGRNKCLLFFTCLCCFCTQAQNFAWKCSLDTVPQTGFYAIPLSPQWLAVLKADIADVRIRDEKEGAVPFLLKPVQRNRQSLFQNFPILANRTDSALTTVVLDAKDLPALNHLELVLGNTAVERRATLSGSNDRQHWFIVDETLFLKNRTGYDKEQFLQTLALPTVRYRYLKLKIRNEGTDPLLIKGAGVFVEWSLDEAREPYFKKQAAFQQNDSADGYSYIRINQEADYPVEKVWLHLYGPKFYARELKVYNGQARKGAELIAAARLQSNTDAVVPVQPAKMKTFLVTVENGDNPPLKVDSVAIQFTQRTLIAYLEKGKRYALVGGNPALAAPAYDLALFRDSIPDSLPAVKHDALLPFAQSIAAAQQSNRWWLWPSIVAVIGLLGFLTVQLLKEVKQKES